MKLSLATLIAVLGALFLSCNQRALNEQPAQIPSDLNSAHEQLLRQMSPQDLRRIRKLESEDAMMRYHFSAGLGMRNGWGLWSGSLLAKYFQNIGIRHPDDMSDVILRTLWCRVHGQPFRLEERAAIYQHYWREIAPPEDQFSPVDGAKVDFRWAFGSGSNMSLTFIHVGRAESDRTFWGYEHGRGLYRADADLVQRVREEEKFGK